MLKLLSAAFLAACFATPLLAQETTANVESPHQQLPAAPRPAMAEQVPFVSFAAGFTYLQTDLADTPGGANGYLMGWYAIPEYHITKHISVIGDLTNFGNYHAHSTENVHGFTGGPVYSFAAFHGITPYAFVEGGAVRDSKAGAVNWNPAAVGGFGANLKITRTLAFQLIPAEYVATKLPNGNWQSNYTTKVGLVLTGFRTKRHG